MTYNSTFRKGAVWENGEDRHRLSGPWESLITECQMVGKLQALVQNQASQLTSDGYLLTNGSGSINQLSHLQLTRLTLDYSQWDQVFGSAASGQARLTVFNKRRVKDFCITALNDEKTDKLRQIFRKFCTNKINPYNYSSPWPEKLTKWKEETLARYKRLTQSDKGFVAESGALYNLLTGVIKKEIPLRIYVAGDTASLEIKVNLSEAGHKNSIVWSCNTTSLIKLDLNALGKGWIVSNSCICCGKNIYSLEFYSSSGQVQLILKNTEEHLEETWQSLLTSLCTTCHGKS
ncbi:MAG: hypothetical protein ACJ0BN_11790 [Limisphaerales bacterium]|nr:MAG: hypothetical protein EVA71_02620 [Limisphaerales bacterium]HAW00832.1 hypothetical protein [Verrucomicrobiales bacterium]